MSDHPAAVRRHLVSAVLIFVLTLAGAGRGLATASSLDGVARGSPGVVAPICHAGAADGSAPGDPPHHDCCDECALLAPVVLADPPLLARPAPVMHFADHANAIAWVPFVTRLHTPRQSQGPPAA